MACCSFRRDKGTDRRIPAQMVSLLHLADITEEGVTFSSPVDGSRMLLTPEHSIRIQNQLGALSIVCKPGQLRGLLAKAVPASQRSRALGAQMSDAVPSLRGTECRCRHHHGAGRCGVQRAH